MALMAPGEPVVFDRSLNGMDDHEIAVGEHKRSMWNEGNTGVT
jgi:hypothetical protein